MAYWLFDLDTAGPIGLVILIAIANAVLGVALGLFCSAFARTEFQAVQFMPIVVVPQILLCGLFVARDQMAGWLQAISDVLPMTYAVEALQEVGAHPEADRYCCGATSASWPAASWWRSSWPRRRCAAALRNATRMMEGPSARMRHSRCACTRREEGCVARTGRRPGHQDTREAILAAAREAFAERGFDGASIRLIAAGAGVDPALVHHYFGTKDQLFLDAMQAPIDPAQIIPQALAGGVDGVGERLVRTLLGVWDSRPAVRRPHCCAVR